MLVAKHKGPEKLEFIQKYERLDFILEANHSYNRGLPLFV